MNYLKYLPFCWSCRPAGPGAGKRRRRCGEWRRVARSRYCRRSYRLPVSISQSGQSISVLGKDEIADIQGADFTRVLERLPGLTFSRTAGSAAFTGVRVRGANSEQLLVLVDGIRVADVASPGGGYDFGNLQAAGIGRIELLRGVEQRDLGIGGAGRRARG